MRPVMRRHLTTLLLLVFSYSCLPLYIREPFQRSCVDAIPRELLRDSEEVLVFPCWRWVRQSRVEYGPPLRLPKDNLDRLPAEVKTWHGFEVVDPFSHEGSKSPTSCGLFLAGSAGIAIRIDYEYDSSVGTSGELFWSREYARIGPRIRTGLMESLTRDEVALETVELIFSPDMFPRNCSILGDPEELELALGFVQVLESNGDDIWHAMPRHSVWTAK